MSSQIPVKVGTTAKLIQRVVLIIMSVFTVGAVGTGAVMRYVFQKDLYGAEEFITIAAFWLYFTGAIYATHTRKHISAEIFSTFCKNVKIRRIVYFLSATLTLLLALLYSYWGWQFFYWSMTEGGRSLVWQIPLVLGHTAVFVGFVFMAYYFLANIKEDIADILNIKIRLASQYPENHPTTNTLSTFLSQFQEISEQNSPVKIHPDNELGDYTHVYDDLKLGTIGMALITVPSQLDSKFDLQYIPYLVTDYEEARRVYAPDSELHRLMSKLHEQQGVKFLGFHAEGFGGIAFTRQIAINTENPAINRECALRVPPMEVFKVALEDNGFDAVPIPYTELNDALENDRIGASCGTTAVDMFLQHKNRVQVFLANNFFFETTSFLVSMHLWDSLSEHDREMLEKIALALSTESFQVAENNDELYLKKFESNGVQVLRLSPIELKEWAEHARKITWPKLEKLFGSKIIK